MFGTDKIYRRVCGAEVGLLKKNVFDSGNRLCLSCSSQLPATTQAETICKFSTEDENINSRTVFACYTMKSTVSSLKYIL